MAQYTAVRDTAAILCHLARSTVNVGLADVEKSTKPSNKESDRVQKVTMEDDDVVTLSVDAATGNLRMIEGRLYWTSIPEARTIQMSDMRHYHRARRWLYAARYLFQRTYFAGSTCAIFQHFPT